MKNYISYKKIALLIAKEVGEIISDEEKKVLKDWTDESNENKILYRKLKNSENFKSRNEKVQQIDINAGWEGIAVKMKKVKRISVTRKILQYAASVITLMMLGWGGYFLYEKITEPGRVEQVAEIKPGTTKATLILDDGKTVNLETNEEFSLTEKDGTVINRTKEQLDYSKKIEKDKTEAIYNTVYIPIGGEFNLTLSDGTHVFLNSMSQIKYPVQFIGNERKVELTGEAYFEVAKNRGKPFIVTTGTIDIEVLGTTFNINAYENSGEIITTLVEGKVKINSPEKAFDETIMLPNDQARFDTQKSKLEVSKVDATLYTAWKDGRFIFYDQRLEDIMNILTRWYSANVFYLNPSVKELRFSGNLDRYGDINHILEIIKSTDKVNLEIKGNNIMFFEK